MFLPNLELAEKKILIWSTTFQFNLSQDPNNEDQNSAFLYQLTPSVRPFVHASIRAPPTRGLRGSGIYLWYRGLGYNLDKVPGYHRAKITQVTPPENVVFNYPTAEVFGLREEAGEEKQKPRGQSQNMQTPQR